MLIKLNEIAQKEYNPKTEILRIISDNIKGTKWSREIFVVGNTVRKLLNNKPIGTIELVVFCPKGHVSFTKWLEELLPKYGTNIHTDIREKCGDADISLHFGKETKVVVNIHVSMTRKDSYFNNSSWDYKAEYGSISEDGKRRGLVPDSLYMDIISGVVFGSSIEATKLFEKKLVAINGDAMSVIEERPELMLETIALSCEIGWKIHKDTWLAILKNKSKLDKVDTEIVRDLFKRIINTRNAAYGIEELKRCGLLKFIIPELYDIMNTKTQDVSNYYRAIFNLSNCKEGNFCSKMACLLLEIGKTKRVRNYGRYQLVGSEKTSDKVAMLIAKRLKFTSEEILTIKKCVEMCNAFNTIEGVPTDKSLRNLINNSNKSLTSLCHVIKAVRSNESMLENLEKPWTYEEIEERIKELQDKTRKVKLPFDGNELMEHFNLSPSRIVGELMSKSRQLVEGNNSLTKDEVFKLLSLEMSKTESCV